MVQYTSSSLALKKNKNESSTSNLKAIYQHINHLHIQNSGKKRKWHLNLKFIMKIEKKNTYYKKPSVKREEKIV